MTYAMTMQEAEAVMRCAEARAFGFLCGLLMFDTLTPGQRKLAEDIKFEHEQARFAFDHALKVEANKALHVPYEEFCRHPEKCAGLSSCPRDPICCD